MWLLNVAAMTVGRPTEAVPEKFRLPDARFQSRTDFPKFLNVATDLNVDTFSLAGGAVADDFDGDHWIDIAVSNWDTDGQLEFFRNKGDGTFERKTAEANLLGITGGLNINQADYDNDGDLDLFVMRGGWLGPNGTFPNSLLQNDGNGRFHDVTFEVGLGEPFLPTQSSAWADYDNDGDLDLYVGNEGAPNQLFQNSSGKFRDIAREAGVNDPSMSKGVAWGDVNGDDLPDIYVSNLGEPNRLYINQGGGIFVDQSGANGVDEPTQGFPTWFWDYDNDGHLDLYASSFEQGVEHIAADYLGRGPKRSVDAHYRGDGKGGFKNVTDSLGLAVTTQPMGCNFGDLDNDGFLDFYLGTGYPAVEGIMPNLMFRNVGGKRFEDVSTAGGFGHLQKGHGIAFADFDNDGDQDVLAELGGWFAADGFQNALFENPGFESNWIKIILEGEESNRFGVGARICLTVADAENERKIYRTVGYGSSFGGNPLRQEIGVGAAAEIKTIEVHWAKTGKTQRFSNIAINQIIVIRESEQAVRTPKIPRS
ncbi:CRTAC1 family protein [Stieleria marina]|uniref:CRTAC1 family protein n=1 Tax=Stieleria marina TaxID=1930275 RepID=UPI003AF395C5